MSEDVQNPKSRGLGRGLNSLFVDDESLYGDSASGRAQQKIGVDMLEPGKGQPRRIFDNGSLQELADSIKRHGILQPLLVRKAADSSGMCQIIAGERRWRAAQKAGLHEVPVIMMDISELKSFELALIENLQREDLNPIEEAQGYKRLIDIHNYTQEQLADSLGKSRSHIANMMRLMQLPTPVQSMLNQGKLSVGHARALITAKDPEGLAKEVVSKGLSVRETENLAALHQDRPAKHESGPASSSKSKNKDVNTRALEKEVSAKLGMNFVVEGWNGKKGKVKIEFRSLDQLEEIVQLLSGSLPHRLSQ